MASIKVKPKKAFTIVDLAGLSSGLYHIEWSSAGDFICQPYVVEQECKLIIQSQAGYLQAKITRKRNLT